MKISFRAAYKAVLVPALAGLVLAGAPGCSNSDKHADSANNSWTETTVTEGGYTYTTVPGDPMKTRIYTLANGLKVYLSVYKDAPRIQTYIAVKAGSRNDPATATGLAHYLEHMMFKGTSKIGADAWDKEKPLLDSIEALYEKYRGTKDAAERKAIYAQIDKVSGEAAKFAVANEYDKLASNLGAEGTNAFTTSDHTVYVNDIPSNTLSKWVEVESERFGELTPRLFHTELEAVYEEKNRSLDSDFWQEYELVFQRLMPVHPYGSQTTIGTIEHLKNPSITEIKKYFNTFYVPNNMAICLSGDLDPDATIKVIDQHFGKMKRKEIPAQNFPVEQPITAPKVDTLKGPQEENLMLGFRTGGKYSNDDFMLLLAGDLLSNGKAGILDLNLNQKQKLREGFVYLDRMNDYDVVLLGGKPRTGQSMDEVKNLLTAQLDSLKQGHFDDNLLTSVINNRKISAIRQTESNGRAMVFVEAFSSGQSLASVLSQNDRLSKITKQEVMDFAKKTFGNNYAVVYKKSGKNPNLQKVDKPAITPVAVNREKSSVFFKAITAKPSPSIEPAFLDFTKDIKVTKLPSGAKVIYKKNEENKLFSAYYLFETGSNNDKVLPLAAKYLKFLGTKKYTPEALQQEFYQLGSTFEVYPGRERTYVIISGIDENFDKTMDLFEGLLKDPQPNPDALANLIADEKSDRTDAKKNKDRIRAALTDYALYGAKNPTTNVLSNSELDGLKPETLISDLQSLLAYQHDVLYYGPRSEEALTATIKEKHITPASLKPVSIESPFKMQAFDKNEVLFTHFDMVQAEIVFLSKSVAWNREMLPAITMFNEYFGGNMGSIVFQELRESKALAYSTYATYRSADKKQNNYMLSYIGSQSDKFHQAVAGMQGLLNDVPQSEAAFSVTTKALNERLRSARTTKGDILLAYENAQKLGVDVDLAKEIFEQIQSKTLADVKSFADKYVKNQKTTMVVVADKDRVKMADLQKYGQVKVLSLSDVFGY
ncbi:MAG: insulinase family protein [Bacteroidota bacterium]